jgi:hypothetical protein
VTGQQPNSIRVEVWPTSEGTLHRALLTDVAPGDRAAAVAAVLGCVAPGSVVVVSEPDVRDGLLAAGAQLVRHLHAMKHQLRDVPALDLPAGTRLRAWQPGDAELLAPAIVAAYGPEHVDPVAPDLAAAARRLAGMVDDPDNPLLPEGTRVAETDDGPVGAAVVLRSEHFSGWQGPWLMNVFRHPHAARGTGAALVTGAMTALEAAGERRLGLAVTATNPARRTYHRLGFEDGFEGWVLVLPTSDQR